jgi:4-phytase/acid phosphatase
MIMIVVPASLHFCDVGNFMIQRIFVLVLFLTVMPGLLAESSDHSLSSSELRLVIYVTRHGVRSPTNPPSQYNVYSSAPWPTWDVPPGYLTKHGYQLMELFGAYDRLMFAKQGLLSAGGCSDADKVTFYADSDQRTRETGKALAAGMFPGCKVTVLGKDEGVNDPLFHPPSTDSTVSANLAVAAIAGRIGSNPDNLTEAHKDKLKSLDRVLASCGTPAGHQKKRISLLDIPATLAPGKGDKLADLRGPLNTASTLTENILLEYVEGMDISSVGWGCVDGTTLRSLLDLHTAASDFAQRTPLVAQTQASNLLNQINKALEQAVSGKPVEGALSRPESKALILVGHDTNLANISGALNLTWVIDGRRDDTPPGGALMFELWKDRASGSYSVRMFYAVQTLEQMREATPLTIENPPQRVPVFLPGCSGEDLACSWPVFAKVMGQVIAP